MLLLNRHGELDEDGNRSPWVELYNRSRTAVNLGHYVLTDDVKAPTQGLLSPQVIEPGEIALVHMSGKNRATHASFELTSGAQMVVLTTATGETLDAVPLPRQTEDRSYGRVPDGTGEFRYLLIPTPGRANRGPESARPIPARPLIHPEGGFYGQGRDLDVTISSVLPSSGGEIRYTTDGSPPEATSLLYARPIRLVASEGNRVVRAAEFRGGERVSPVVTESYFLDGESYRLPVLAFAMPRTAFEDVHLSIEARGPESETPVGLQAYFDDGRRYDAGVGLRLHGFTGRVGGLETKKSYRLHFRDSYGSGKLDSPLIRRRHPPLERVVLRAGNDDAFRSDDRASYVRDELVRRLHEDMGHVASHGSWYNLFSNVDYLGVYNVVERIDRDFLDTHFPPASAWDVIHDGEVAEGTDADWRDLRALVATSDLSDPGRYEKVVERVDIESFTDYIILNVWAQNHDWPHKNFFAARPSGGRWIFLSWDAEVSLGLYPPTHDADTFERAAVRGGSGVSELFGALLTNHRYQELFLDRLEHHFGRALSPENVVARVESLERDLEHDLKREIRERHSASRVAVWSENLRQMERFARERPGAVLRYVYHSPRITLPRVVAVEPSRVSLDGSAPVRLRLRLRGLGFTDVTEVSVGAVDAQIVGRELPHTLEVVLPGDERLLGQPTLTVWDPVKGRSRRRGLLEVTPRSDGTR